MQVRLGNAAPITKVRNDDGSFTVTEVDPEVGHTTEVDLREGRIGDLFTAITAAEGVWAYHSTEDPTWVSSDSKPLAEMLAEHFGCPVVKYDASVVSVLQPKELASVKATKAAALAGAQKIGAVSGGDDKDSE